ncbi:MAG: hypothetical protein ACOVNU_05240 [Candidatus Kapaibacteriota bacterium]
MSIPSSVSLPSEMNLSAMDISLPPSAKSYSVKIQPSNVSSVVSPNYTMTASSTPLNGLAFPSQTIYFDLPCGSSPSTFLDTRFTTLSYRVTIAVQSAGSSSIVSSGYLRSGAYSFIDRAYLTSQNGGIIEDISEYGLTYDLLTSLQLNPALRDSLALQYGFNESSAVDAQQGIVFGILGDGTITNTLAAGQTETRSFSYPLLSSLIGCTAQKMFNIGRTNKLQLALQTCVELPLTITTGLATTAGTINVTLSDFALQMEYVDIGADAMAMLDSTLVGGKAFYQGITYKTSAVVLPAVAGSQSLLVGARGSSIKSLFARFYDLGANSATNSYNGKYDSKNPNINLANFNIGGIKYPNNPVNPLLNPAQAFRGLQMAIGSFNNSQFQSCIVPSAYCKLSAGGTAKGLTNSTQAYDWSVDTSAVRLANFFYGENLEVIARRGVMSGINCNSSPVFLELNIASAPTNAHNVYVTAQMDCIYVHDVMSGDINVRI